MIASDDAPLEDMEYVTVTPAETFLPGTIPPPPTPYVQRGTSPSPFESGIIGASVEALQSQSPAERPPREGYLGRDFHTEDANIPTPAEALTEVKTDDYIEFTRSSEPVDPAERSHQETQDDFPVESELPEPTLLTDDGDVHTRSETESPGFEKAAVLGIPVVIAASSSIGIMATATHSKQQTPPSHPRELAPALNDQGASVDHIPVIRVDSTSPDAKDAFEVHGPFIEPLKYHVQPDEISPIPADSTILKSPQVFIPFEPTHLPPSKDLSRPSTSYSWLGALFGPISPEILEAQRTGWVAISSEMNNEPPVRRRSTKLRRRTREIFMREQVRNRSLPKTNITGSRISRIVESCERAGGWALEQCG